MAADPPVGSTASTTQGDMTALGQLDLPQLRAIFTNLNTSVPKVSDSAQEWGQLGNDVTQAMTGGTSLTAMATPLQTWSGAGSDAFKQKVSTVTKWGAQLGATMGAGSTGSQNSVSNVLGQVGSAMTTSYANYLSVYQPDWQSFISNAASYFNNFAQNATAVANGGQPTVPSSATGYSMTPTAAGPISSATRSSASRTTQWSVSYSESGYTARANVTATETTQVSPGLAQSSYSNPQIQLLAGPTPSSVTPTGQTTAAGATVNGQQIEDANKDQYRNTLVIELTGLSVQYREAIAGFPAKLNPLSATYNPAGQTNGFGGSGGTSPAISAPNVPTGTSSVKGAAPSTGGVGASGGAGSVPNSGAPTTSTSPLSGASATSGTGGSGTGSTPSGANTPTSLASAPTGSSPSLPGASSTGSLGGSGTGLGGTGGLGSLGGTPTGLAGAGSTGTVGGGTVPIFPIGAGGAFSGGGLGGSGGLSGAGLGGGGVAGELSPSEAGTTGDGVIGGSGALGEAAGGTSAEAGLAGASTAAGRQTPYMPYMPMSPGMSGANEERGRSVWLDEEDDVWSTGTDPAPAVIGGEI
jgi:hypothetical protein